MQGNICLTEKSITKTNVRYTAEHYLIGSMVLLITIAKTHFYLAEEEHLEWRQFLTKLPNDVC